jgi:eukaryotic-like serine/threonine-protein kinase
MSRETSSGTSVAPSLAPGQTFAGRYRVISHLGSGGMGDVYEVEHVLLGKRFAIKRLSVEGEDDQARIERFLREARAAAATGHPGVVDVVDVGFAEDELPYLVMERLDGETLRRRLDRGAVGEAMLKKIAHRVLDALGAVHAAGIVHRDLKPENLFLCRDGRLVILDFGLSHDAAVDVRLTRSGAVMGTPLYMAPEQARGEDVDARTDLYAVGAVLYECAAGRPPFAAPAYSVLVAMILEQTPDPEPLAHLEAPVREVILRALAKRLAERPRSAAEMREPFGEERDEGGWEAPPEERQRADRGLTTAPTIASGPAVRANAAVSTPDVTKRERPARKSPSTPTSTSTSTSTPTSTSTSTPTPTPTPTGTATDAATGTATATTTATSTATSTATATATAKRWWPIAFAAAAAFGAAAIIALASRRGSSTKPPPRVQLAVTGSQRLTLDPGCEEYPRFTPDATHIVYDGVVEGDSEILSIPLGGGPPERLTRAAGWDYAPAISPDGARIAYVHEDTAGRTLRVVGIAGDQAGPTVDLGRISGYPAWTRDGALLVGDPGGRILRRELASDGSVDRETVLGRLPAGARPYHLVDVEGAGVAMLWWTSSDADAAALGELDRDGTLRVIEEATVDYDGGIAPSAGARGYYATRKGVATGNQLLWRPWGGGAPEVVPGGIAPRAGVDVSRDGKRLAFSTCTETPYIARLREGAAPEVMSRGEWQDTAPVAIAPDRVLIGSNRLGSLQAWLLDINGAAVRRRRATASRSSMRRRAGSRSSRSAANRRC